MKHIYCEYTLTIILHLLSFKYQTGKEKFLEHEQTGFKSDTKNHLLLINECIILSIPHTKPSRFIFNLRNLYSSNMKRHCFGNSVRDVFHILFSLMQFSFCNRFIRNPTNCCTNLDSYSPGQILHTVKFVIYMTSQRTRILSDHIPDL